MLRFFVCVDDHKSRPRESIRSIISGFGSNKPFWTMPEGVVRLMGQGGTRSRIKTGKLESMPRSPLPQPALRALRPASFL